ncbi:Uncharacterised protein [Citrobacter freundii]|nr:Uncharacterised protein [Citrobacter freundii]
MFTFIKKVIKPGHRRRRIRWSPIAVDKKLPWQTGTQSAAVHWLCGLCECVPVETH